MSWRSRQLSALSFQPICLADSRRLRAESYGNTSHRWIVLAVLIVSTWACGRVTPAPGSASVTFTKDIAPLLSTRCGACHRPGEPAPFSVFNYDDVRVRARRIAEVTRNREMPPWLPESGYGQFADERRLRDDEIDLIGRWVSEGAPRGELADHTPAVISSEGWQLGTPDMVVTMARPYTLQPSDTDHFRNFVIPVPSTGTRYVRGVELRASDMKTIHHGVLMVDPTGASRRFDAADPEPGFEGMESEAAHSPMGHLVGWTPGKVPRLEEPALAWRLDKGTDLVLQLHMMPSANPATIEATLGLFFSETPPTEIPFLLKLSSKTIDIPAGAREYQVTDRYVLPGDVDVLSVYPHAHYLARQMKGFVTLPDGTVRWLIWIKQWDFRWQDVYRYTTPLFLPKASVLTMQYEYDNSADNPHASRRPPGRVIYGPRSSDEMADLWVQVLPRNPADLAVLARDYGERERRSQIAGAEHLLVTNPNDAGRRNLLGARYLEEGRVSDAIAQFEAALGIKSDHAEAHNNLGSALKKAGRMPEAIQHYEQAARLSPGDDRIQFNLASALQSRGQLAEAVDHYKRAVALNPDSADAQNNLGVALASQGRGREAIAHFKRAVAINPEYADAHSNLGLALVSSGDLEAAVLHLQRALEIQPEHADARHNLALVLKWGRSR